MIDLDQDVEVFAAICHEVNRAYCKSIGDDSQVSWQRAPQWQRESAIKGVQAHLSDETLTGRGSHDLWMAEKEKDGWTWGHQKDVERKLHPCMVPYESLPENQRTKDYLFKAVIDGVREGLKEPGQV